MTFVILTAWGKFSVMDPKYVLLVYLNNTQLKLKQNSNGSNSVLQAMSDLAQGQYKTFCKTPLQLPFPTVLFFPPYPVKLNTV